MVGFIFRCVYFWPFQGGRELSKILTHAKNSRFTVFFYFLLPHLHETIFCQNSAIVDGFIFVGNNFRGLNKNDTFVGFKIRGYSIFLS